MATSHSKVAIHAQVMKQWHEDKLRANTQEAGTLAASLRQAVTSAEQGYDS